MSAELHLTKIKLGGNADTSKNFVISVPAVADGTLTIERENGTDVLTIDSSGKVTFGSVIKSPDNLRAFKAYRTSTNQGVSSGVITKVALNSKSFDTKNEFDEATNFRFQPTVAGYYMITGAIRINGTTQTQQACYLYKNGSLYSLGNRSVTSTSSPIGVSIVDLVYLNGTTDYVELYGQVTASSGTVFEANDGTYMSGYLVGAA